MVWIRPPLQRDCNEFTLGQRLISMNCSDRPAQGHGSGRSVRWGREERFIDNTSGYCNSRSKRERNTSRLNGIATASVCVIIRMVLLLHQHHSLPPNRDWLTDYLTDCWLFSFSFSSGPTKADSQNNTELPSTLNKMSVSWVVLDTKPLKLSGRSNFSDDCVVWRH